MGMWKCRSIRFVDGEESMTGFEVAVDFLDAPGPKKSSLQSSGFSSSASCKLESCITTRVFEVRQELLSYHFTLLSSSCTFIHNSRTSHNAMHAEIDGACGLLEAQSAGILEAVQHWSVFPYSLCSTVSILANMIRTNSHQSRSNQSSRKAFPTRHIQ